jgi:sensor c-di-GMP phosphodiesterase-like protein
MSSITPAEVAAAVWNDELFLEYLPIVSLDGGRCVGAEALVRWRCGEHVIAPLEFIPIVESTPVCGLVTYWVIDTVARELATWLRAHDGVHIAINVPPEVFGRGGLTYAAAKARLLDLASKFVLEITERGIPDKIGVEAINSRPRNGVLVALDDVCANHAAWLVAAQLRLDILKIEKASVDQITRREL